MENNKTIINYAFEEKYTDIAKELSKISANADMKNIVLSTQFESLKLIEALLLNMIYCFNSDLIHNKKSVPMPINMKKEFISSALLDVKNNVLEDIDKGRV